MSPDEELAHFEERGLSWTAEVATTEAVREQIARHVNELEELRGASLIKRNMVRSVLRVPLREFGHVIVKRYAVRGPVDWAKYTFKPSRAKAEWIAGRALDAAGIPTAVPLAMAERRRGVLRDAALVTREIADALHLNAYVEKHLGEGREEPRAAFYRQLAELVRRMHDAGLLHNDLHGGNVLVSGPPDAPRAHVIDLHSVSRGRRANARWFDLVKLLHSMRTCSTPAERAAICRRYEEAGDGPSLTPLTSLLERSELGAVLEPRLARMEQKRRRSRTARALGESSKFKVSSTPDGSRIHHLRALPVEVFPPLLKSHAATIETGGKQVLKDARRSALTRQTMETADGARSVIVKQYRSAGLAAQLKNVLRRPRALAAWVAGNGLIVRHFAAAEPLALVRSGVGPFAGDAYVVMDDLGDATRLDLVSLARFAGDIGAESRREKYRLIDAVARLFRTLHAEGVYHADLKAVNLFVRDTAEGPEIVLADYDRVEFDRPLSERRRIKNLAQLSASIPICISLADRLRFFREYAAHEPDVRAVWKHWFREVIAQCRRKIVVRMEPIE